MTRMALFVSLSALLLSTMSAAAADHELKLIPGNTHTGSFDAPYFIADVLPRLVQLGILTSHARGPNLASSPGPGRLGTRRSECCPAGADPDEV
jgi:hypothetical protein